MSPRWSSWSNTAGDVGSGRSQGGIKWWTHSQHSLPCHCDAQDLMLLPSRWPWERRTGSETLLEMLRALARLGTCCRGIPACHPWAAQPGRLKVSAAAACWPALCWQGELPKVWLACCRSLYPDRQCEAEEALQLPQCCQRLQGCLLQLLGKWCCLASWEMAGPEEAEGGWRLSLRSGARRAASWVAGLCSASWAECCSLPPCQRVGCCDSLRSQTGGQADPRSGAPPERQTSMRWTASGPSW